MLHSPDDLTVCCSNPDRIIGVVNSLMPMLSADIRKRFNHLRLAVLQSEGKTGMHARFNGRTVADIIADDTMPSLGSPIDTGRVDGIRYRLYDPDDEA